MKIVIVSPFAPPEQGACSYRVHSYIDFLKKNGHAVQVLSPERNNVKGQGSIRRYNGITDLMSLVFHGKYDIVLGTSPPLTHSFFALLAAKFSGKKFVLEARDLWTYALKKLGTYNKFSPKLFVYSIFELISYRFSDKLFGVTPGLVKVWNKSLPANKKAVLILNGTDTSLFKPSETERKIARCKLGINKKAVLGAYAGSFSDWELDTLLMKLVPMFKSRKNFFFLLVISTASCPEKFAKIKQILGENGIEKKVFVADLAGLAFDRATKKISRYLSAADFAVSCTPKGFDFYLQVKNYDYMAMNLPIIALGPKQGDLKQIFKQHKIGYYCGGWNELKEKIGFAADNIESMKKRFPKNRVVAENYFLRDRSNAKALKEFESLVSRL